MTREFTEEDAAEAMLELAEVDLGDKPSLEEIYITTFEDALKKFYHPSSIILHPADYKEMKLALEEDQEK